MFEASVLGLLLAIIALLVFLILRMQADFKDSAKTQADAQRNLSLDLVSRVGDIRSDTLNALAQNFHNFQTSTQSLQQNVQNILDRLRTENQTQHEKMRLTVEEKLHTTLNTRLGESFQMVSERLEQVHKGLGEMQSLATGVGDLKRVLTNVRTRGTYGETQLNVLLDQVLVPSQYEKNFATVPGSSERVEFAIRLPGADDGHSVYLPIDAKFPAEDFDRLQTASMAGDSVGIEESVKALRRRLLDEGLKIRKKYVSPPHTTDFGLMFLPTEGLYAEVMRAPGLFEELQNEKIIPVGPSTLYAVLSSLHMGFRTLAIQKRSNEVWHVLGAVKTEFHKFGKALEDVKSKLEQATSKISETEKRSRVMERTLKSVENLDDAQAAHIFSGQIHELEA